MRKGFTLIELLIVIGILAILATTVVLVLNPAQILQESRDTQRVSDLSSVQSAVGLMLATAASVPTFGITPQCTVTGCAVGTPATCGGFTKTGCLEVTSRAIDGNGWVGIDLRGTAGGSPLSALPVDPTSSATYYYAYLGCDSGTCDGGSTAEPKTYELNARLESAKLRVNMTNDGGDDNTCSTYVESTCWYEIGTNPSLNL